MSRRLRGVILGLALCACFCLSGDRATGFSYFSYGGLAVIWWGNAADRYLSTITFQPEDLPDELMRASMGQWSSVWGADFQYYFGYVSEGSTILDPFDGYSMTVAVPASSLDPGVLGVTYMVSFGDIWYDMDLVFSDFPEGAGWHMLTDPDCEITDNPAPDNGFSFYLVALHELGHAVGLGHDPIGDEPAGSTWRIGVMNPAYPAGGPIGNQNIIELHTDERRAMRFLYPGASEPVMDLGNSGYTAKGPRLGKAQASFFTPATITPGEELTMWAMVENLGTLAASNVRHAFYLSTDSAIDATDMPLGNLVFNVLTNARMEFAAATTIPDLPAGTYYLGSILDDANQVVEEYEDNNQADYCDPLAIAQATPVFGSYNQQIITCDEPYTSATPAVSYPVNMAPITWSVDNPQPGMTVNPGTGVLHWPAPVKSPFIYEFVLRSTNGAGTSTQTIRLGVHQPPPRIAAIANHATKCGASYTGPTPALTAPTCMSPISSWSLLHGPPGMTINPSSGVVSWPNVDPGHSPYLVEIRAANQAGESAESWLLYVAPSDGDLDADGFINAQDFELFAPCVDGPQVDPTAACVCSDLDQDADVDLRDFARLTLVFSGETIQEGACCISDGNCALATPDHCATLSGYYQGDGTTCGQVSCTGACCFFTGGCLTFILDNCNVAGGTFQGMNTRCQDLTCPAGGTGACCLPNESCTTASPLSCAASGGESQGVGMSCAAVDCSDPVGACCHADSGCAIETEADCSAGGGAFIGDGSVCSANVCNGACCYPHGSCLDLNAEDCAISAGEFQGPETDCGTFDCPIQPVGACCQDDLSCTEETQTQCAGFGGSFQGNTSSCVTANCPVRGACCLPNETCTILTPAACGLQSGTYLGDGASCSGVDCSLSEVGACYDPDDWSCQEVTAGICAAFGGAFEGAGTTCASTYAPEYRNVIANPTTFYGAGANIKFADDMTLAGTSRGLSYYDLAVAGSSGPAFSVDVALYDNCPGQGGTLIAGTEQTWTGVPADGSAYILSAELSANPIRLPHSVWMVVKFSSATAGWVIAGPAEVGSTQDRLAEEGPPWFCDFSFGGPPNDHAGFWANLQCVELPEPQGACCLPSESCTFGTLSGCAAASGVFMGENVQCANVDCASVNVGACCNVVNWSCSLTEAAECAAAGGSFDGVGTGCSEACPEYLNEIDPVTLSYNPGQPMAEDLELAGTARDLARFSVVVYGGGGGSFDIFTAFYDGSPCAGGTLIPGSEVSGAGLPDGQPLTLTATLPTPVTLPDDPWLVMEFSTPFAGWIVAEDAEVGATANVFALAEFDGQDWNWTCNNTIEDAYGGFWASLQLINAGAGLLRKAAAPPVIEITPIDSAPSDVRSVFHHGRAGQVAQRSHWHVPAVQNIRSVPASGQLLPRADRPTPLWDQHQTSLSD